MKVNLKLELEEMESDLPQIEEKIIDYINQYQEKEYEKIFNQDSDIEIVKALSDIRKNIIRWYPFQENSTVLEIGAHLGELTGELCNKVERVVAIEFSKKRAEAIEKRHADKENLELIVGNLFKIDLEEKFDYITIMNPLESAETLKTDIENIFEYAKQRLKVDGKILLVADNKFGMRSWSNIRRNTNSKRFQAVASPVNKLLTKEKLDQLIQKQGFCYHKYYYVLPDANFTNVIFTDKFLPNHDNITRNITIFDEDEIINFHENDAYINILKDNPTNFSLFANTFFVEIGNAQEENEIQYISFGNLRKPKYRIQTIIKEKEVYKTAIGSKTHLDVMKSNIDYMNQLGIKTLDHYDEKQIISQYVKNAKTLDKVIIQEYQENGIEKVKELINRFFHELGEKLTKVENTNNVFDRYHIDYSQYPIQDLHFVKEGLWDLTFQNCFYIDQEFYFYDQEWFEENVPLEFIIYRNILYFHELKQYIKEEELYKELGILPYKNLFEILDNKLQEEIRDDLIWKLNIKPMQNIQQLINHNEFLKEESRVEKQKNEVLEKEKEALMKRQNELEQEVQQKTEELSGIYNSKSWKAISKLRNIIHG